jgi:hypothetical protein
LLGFNNNVRHRGRVFHIQTEDSGMRHARIVTHLFADGGRIVRTTRTDYSDVLGRQDTTQVLRQMMKEQHKSMFMDLRAGKLDALIDDVFGESSDSDKSSDKPAGSFPAADPEAAPTEHASLEGSSPAGQMDQVGGDGERESPATMAESAEPKTPAAEVTLQRVVSVGEPSAEAEQPAVAESVQPAAESVEEQPERVTQAGMPPASSEPDEEGARQPAESVPHTQEREGSSEREGPSIFGGTTSSGQTLDNVILSYLAEGIEEETPQD